MNGRDVLTVILLVVAGVCMITDLRDGRIYNVVLVPSTILGLLLRTFPICGGSTMALGSALMRIGTILLLLLPVWAFVPGGIGGGDVKLYVAIAILLENDTLLPFLLLSLVISASCGLLQRIGRMANGGLRIGPAVWCAAVLYAGGIYG